MASAPALLTLFGEAPVLRLSIPGPLVSGNHKTGWRAVRKVRDEGTPQEKVVWVCMSYTTPEGREYDERIKTIVAPAVWKLQWKPVPWACMDVVIWNSLIDRDNVNKVIADALEGIAFPTDTRVIDGRLVKMWDKRGERVDVEIREVDPRQYGRKG